jgi:hypothetical protein
MPSRYIITCAICECLTDVGRCDAITCSPRCRVYLHRHPKCLDRLREIARGLRVDLFGILEAGAIRSLRPDLADRVAAGELEIADVRDEVARTFNARVMELARAK